MTTDDVERAASHPIRTTWPEVWKEIWPKHLTLIVILGLLTIVLAVLPTLKSQFESATFSSISDSLKQDKTDSIAFADALAKRLPDSSRNAHDLVEKLAAVLLRDSTLRNVLIAYVALVFATALFEIAGAFVRGRLVQSVLAALRARGVRNALMLETPELADAVNVSGHYANAIQQGAKNVANMYEYWFRIGESLLAAVFAFLAIWSKSGDLRFAFVVLAIAGTLVGLSFLQQKLLKKKREQFDDRINALLAQTDDVLSKREILAAYEQQDRYSEEVSKTTWKYADVRRRLGVWEETFFQSSRSVMDFGQLAILLMALKLVADKDIGDTSFVIFLYMRLLQPTQDLISRYTSLRRAQATSRTFLKVFARTSSTASHSSKPASATTGTSLRFENVTFAYPPAEGLKKPNKNILENLTFEAPGGQVTLLLGPSGCGKSTIARIALAFWHQQSGKVLVGGREISEFPSGEEVRKLMSYVAQGDHIVDATIRENLSWATRAVTATDAQMHAALTSVGLGSFSLEEKAKNMSLGQQQRLSVARLILDESPILILDEPLSGADVFTTAELLPQLVKVLATRTALIISHKLSLASLAHHVVVLDHQAKVVDQGNPEDRVKAGGEFANVYNAALKELQI